MILGLGSDIIDIRRIEAAIGRHGDRFLERIFTPVERAKAARRIEKIRAATYAKRFAAKEAAAKASARAFARACSSPTLAWSICHRASRHCT